VYRTSHVEDAADLLRRLKPLIEAYERQIDPGTSDLYDEQPFSVHTTLGVMRQLALYYTVLARVYLK
jgi:hypothetical protein